MDWECESGLGTRSLCHHDSDQGAEATISEQLWWPLHQDAGQKTKKRSKGEKLQSVWERAEKGEGGRERVRKGESQGGQMEHKEKRGRKGGTETGR